MNPTLYKNARGVEFCNLLQELKDAGIKDADVARKLGKTQSAISQYKSGRTTPTAGTIELMRIWVAEVLKRPLFAAPEMPVRTKLEELERNDPDAFAVAEATVDALHKRMKKASSYVPSEVKAGVAKVAEKLFREDRKS